MSKSISLKLLKLLSIKLFSYLQKQRGDIQVFDDILYKTKSISIKLICICTKSISIKLNQQ